MIKPLLLALMVMHSPLSMSDNFNYEKLDTFLESIESKKTLQQLEAVNWEVNKTNFEHDIDNYGVVDYWATPEEMNNQKKADCEDYAISKYLYLRKLGFSQKNLFITYAFIKRSRKYEAHMVLLVKHKGKHYVLDNIKKRVTPIDNRRDLNLLYGINGKYLYLYSKDEKKFTYTGSSYSISLWKDFNNKLNKDYWSI